MRLVWHCVFYEVDPGAKHWSGVESDFGVVKVEWSAVVMCAGLGNAGIYE